MRPPAVAPANTIIERTGLSATSITLPGECQAPARWPNFRMFQHVLISNDRRPLDVGLEGRVRIAPSTRSQKFMTPPP